MNADELHSRSLSDLELAQREPIIQPIFDQPPIGCSPNLWQRSRQWSRAHKGDLVVGAAAIESAVTLIANPVADIWHDIEASAWVAEGVATTETMFFGGIVLSASAVGVKVGKNPLKIRKRFREICSLANDSLMFKIGFWTNTVGAVGTATVFSAGVLTELPPQSYGVLGLAGVELAGTYILRKAILTGFKRNTDSAIEERSANLESGE